MLSGPLRLFLFSVVAVSWVPASFAPRALAATPDALSSDSATDLAELASRAEHASPRDQCFLYTELVHTMTETAGREMQDGETEKAGATLKTVQQYAQKIHLGLARDTRRVKNAEMLMERTTVRLSEILHKSSGDDRATVQTTLKQLQKVHDELLAQVFQH